MALLSVLLPISPPHAWSTSGERATSAASFLKLPAGARAVGLGGAAVASSRDADALFWNPAALRGGWGPVVTSSSTGASAGAPSRHSAAFSHVEYLRSSTVENGAYRFAAPWGGVAAGFRYLSAGRLDETDAAGSWTGSFAPSDFSVSLGYGAALGSWAGLLQGFSFGAAAKYVESRILTSACAWAADLGALSPAYLGGRLVFGAAVRNLGTSLKFDAETETLPLEGRLGASFKTAGPKARSLASEFLVTADLAAPRDDDPFVGLGVEYSLAQGARWAAAARAGFNSRTVGDVRGFSGAAFGLGWRLGGLGFDYGFEPMGALGSPHHFTLSFSF